MTEEMIAKAEHVLLDNYRPGPFALSRGKGSEVFDTTDKRYVDLTGGIAVNALGHAHPELSKVIAEQAAKLMHVSNLFLNDKEIELASRLTEKTGFASVYFANSGTEASEALFKMARRCHYEKEDKDRVEVIATLGSFHGRSMGALTLTGQTKYHQGIEPLIPGVHHVPYNDLAAIEAKMSNKTAAVLVEPIQGEGGLILGTDEYLRGLRKLCDANGALLLFDEVQTGFGRTGKFLGREWSGVMPDACGLAKGMGGGFPIGAMLVGKHLRGGLPPGSHASTFGGNPLACAASLAVIDIIEKEGLVERAQSLGEHIHSRFSKIAETSAMATESRGRGLLRGIKLADGVDARALYLKLRDEKNVLVTIAGGTVLRIAPALNIEQDLLDEGIDAMAAVVAG